MCGKLLPVVSKAIIRLKMYNRKVMYNNFFIALVHKKFSLVPCQPDDGSLYMSQELL